MSDTGAVALGAGEVAGTVEPVDEATTARDAAAVGGGADVCETPTTLPGTPQPRQASAIARMTRTMTTVRLLMSTSDVLGALNQGRASVKLVARGAGRFGQWLRTAGSRPDLDRVDDLLEHGF